MDCKVDGCKTAAHARGLCQMHDRRERLYGDPKKKKERLYPSICTIDGCGKKSYAYGLCRSHDRRKQLYGDPLVVIQEQNHGLTTAQRFLKRVEKKENGCWDWTASTIGETGYGQFNLNNRPVIASRMAWILFRGEIPEDDSAYRTLHVLHRCDNPKCVNPDHLFLGTHKDNVKDMVAKGRHRFGIHLGKKNKNAKLDEAKVRYIRASCKSCNELARDLEVAAPTIWSVLHGKTWKHIK